MSGRPAGLLRRLAAMVYDLLLLVAVLFVVSIPPVLINGGAIAGDGTLAGQIKHLAFVAYLLTVAFVFHGGFWTHGGQTLGMAAWRLRIVDGQGSSIGWRQALIRWSTACLGLANIGCLFAADRRGWHERWSGSHTVLDPKPPKR